MSDAIQTAEIVPDQSLVLRSDAGAVAPVSESKAPITPAQAKVEAVAALTMSAYQRAATLELTPEETAKLQADFPDEAFQPGAAGKEHLIYIEHAHLRDRFNSVFGMGKWAIVPRNRWAEPFKTQRGEEGSRVYVEAMLVVRGCFVGEAVGAMEYYPHNASQNYGDAVEGAKTAAFRRCAKEFGVGLQAWKKEFCDGWWDRKRGGRDFSRKPAPQPPGRAEPKIPPSTPTPAVKTPPAATSERGIALKPPTEATRKWMLDELHAAGLFDLAQEYFTKLNNPMPLMPEEPLTSLRLIFVPNSRDELKMLVTRLKAFGNGDRAEIPYAWHWEAEGKKAIPAKVALPTEPPKDPLWWRDVIVTVPRKGMKRDAYLKSPDTIGKLYDARHKQDPESEYMRQRLWGLIEKWKPEPRTVGDKTYQPTDADKKFYEALMAFDAWFKDNHRGEKI